MKTLIIVPAYNEEESLPGVIRDLRENIRFADILVVNDGSRDATARTAEEMGVVVVSLPFNLGIGGAMQAGYLYAEQGGYDIAVQFDGDGQHLAGEIEKLLRQINEGSADLVVGSRFLKRGRYNASVFRKIGIWIFSAVLSRILGMPVTDSTSGFRAANRRVITFFSRTYPDDYPEVEALVLLHKAKMRIAEVPVSMRERTGGRSSITPIRSAYYMIKVLLAIFIDLLKK
ncbi:MAG TPA: glycosyltransferase family 2 protein [Nitrospirota bacterium]|nr:glycosyltransferase family 2 protein [Nitrospirota bacterium]